MDDLVARAEDRDFNFRAILPARELGAYEALWARDSTSFKSIADIFRSHPGSVPSDFVTYSDAEKHARLALGSIRDSGIKHFGIRVHGAGEYPPKLRDAQHPVELLYFQGNWNLSSTPVIGNQIEAQMATRSSYFALGRLALSLRTLKQVGDAACRRCGSISSRQLRSYECLPRVQRLGHLPRSALTLPTYQHVLRGRREHCIFIQSV